MSEMEFERSRSINNDSRQPMQMPAQPRTDVAAGVARPVSQMDEAVREFEEDQPSRAPAADPNVINVLMRNAAVLMDAKEHRLAVNILRNIVMRSPDDKNALRRMGLCYREEGRFEDALKCFRGLAKAGGGADAQILIAETLYLGERDEMALGAYREVMRNPIDDPNRLFEVYKNVGNIHVRAGDFESAEEHYNRAYNLNPESDVLMVNYGTLEIQRENLGDAVHRFRRAVEINPNNDKGWVGLAIVHRQMGDHELAWANVLRALDINQGNRTAIRLVVDWAVADHSFSVAIDRMQEYLAIENEDAEMSFTLAKILTHVGRISEARLEMERVLALDPATEGAEPLKKALDRELARIQQPSQEPS